MKKFFNKFFRKDLDLNNKFLHRLVKVLWIILFSIVTVFSVIEMRPSFNGKIIYKGTIVDRLPENGYYRVRNLVKENEYLYIIYDAGLLNIGNYKSNKKILEESTGRNPEIFCSNNRTTENLYKISEEGNLSLYTNVHEMVLAQDILNDLGSKCLGIMYSKQGSGIRSYNSKHSKNNIDSLVEDGGYIYEIIKPNIVLIFTIYLLKILGILLLFTIVSFIIYYKGIIYIIYGNQKKKQ